MDCTGEIVDLVAGIGAVRAAFPSAAAAREQPHARGDAPAVHDRALRARWSTASARGCPHASIGSDIIVGFPGETDDDFEQLAAYLEASPLTHLHVFPYSDRPGTAASAMAGKVHGTVVRERARRVREIGAAADRAVPRRRRSGRVHRALTLEDGSLGGDRQLSEGADSAGPCARNEWVARCRRRLSRCIDGELLARRDLLLALRRSAGRRRRGCRGRGSCAPRRRRRARRGSARSDRRASSDGRSNGMPGAAFSGIRFTFALTPASSFASRRASSGVSLTPASSTYSNVMRLRFFSGKRRQASMMSRDAVLLVDRHELAALLVGRRVQRDREVRHQRLAAPAARAPAAGRRSTA